MATQDSPPIGSSHQGDPPTRAARKTASLRKEHWANILICGALLVACVGAYVFRSHLIGSEGIVRSHLFWLLAFLPGLCAIVNYWVTEHAGYSRRADIIQAWLEILKRRGAGYGLEDDAFKKYSFDAPRGEPRFSYTFFGALALTLVFGLAAELSQAPGGLGFRSVATSSTERVSEAPMPGAAVSPEVTPSGTASPNAASGSEGLSATDTGMVAEAQGASQPAAQESSSSVGQPPDEGLSGFVYAAYGAYVYSIYMIIGRLNAASLSGKFLVRLALRCATAVVLGFVAGELGAFKVVASAAQSRFLYFAIGLFPAWAMRAVRTRARELLVTEEPESEALPLSVVDGLDDDVTDRLAEIGIWDIQHLATVEPVELLIRSSYSPNRVLDWINQAMLITYVRGRIGSFRRAGIRSAVDLAILYGDIIDGMNAEEDVAERGKRADEILKALSQKSDMPVASILAIARVLFEDEQLNVIWLLWQTGDADDSEKNEPPEAVGVKDEPPEAAGVAE